MCFHNKKQIIQNKSIFARLLSQELTTNKEFLSNFL